MIDAILNNLDGLHSTELGLERISRNIGVEKGIVVEYTKRLMVHSGSEIRKQGKNIYVRSHNIVITINASSLTIITAHKLY